jgi:hypothetical protein
MHRRQGGPDGPRTGSAKQKPGDRGFESMSPWSFRAYGLSAGQKLVSMSLSISLHLDRVEPCGRLAATRLGQGYVEGCLAFAGRARGVSGDRPDGSSLRSERAQVPDEWSVA